MTVSDEGVLKLLRASNPEGLKPIELANQLGLDAKGRQRLRKLLEGLLNDGRLEKGRGGAYVLPEAERPKPVERGTGITGRIRVHPAGYGFVERDDGEADVFVPARYRGTALDGDKVRLDTWLGVKGVEGRVSEVVERGRAKLTGVVREVTHGAYLEPDDPRIAATWGHVALEDGLGPAR